MCGIVGVVSDTPIIHFFSVQSARYKITRETYKGVELVRRYGLPAGHRHSLQLEINRRLYMDETTLAIHDGFAPLQASLRGLVELLLRTDPHPHH